MLAKINLCPKSLTQNVKTDFKKNHKQLTFDKVLTFKLVPYSKTKTIAHSNSIILRLWWELNFLVIFVCSTAILPISI